MKKLIIVLVFLAISYGIRGSDNRTKFFPRCIEYPQLIPEKENLWVFILAGQSNMAGRGLVEPQDTIPSQRVLALDANGSIIVAKEPLHFYEPSLTGLDCGLSFGKTLIKSLPDSVSVLIIPTAVGGSSISQWLGDSLHRDVRLLSNFREKVALGSNYGIIKGLLWHQGESDANPDAIPLYGERLSELISIFRDICQDSSLPVLLGELGSFSNNRDNWELINHIIHQYAETDSRSAVISTSDLKDKGDRVHFDSNGQRVMGERFAIEYLRSGF